MLECSRLDPVRQNYLMKYSQYYLGIDAGVSTVIMLYKFLQVYYKFIQKYSTISQIWPMST